MAVIIINRNPIPHISQGLDLFSINTWEKLYEFLWGSLLSDTPEHGLVHKKIRALQQILYFQALFWELNQRPVNVCLFYTKLSNFTLAESTTILVIDKANNHKISGDTEFLER